MITELSQLDLSKTYSYADYITWKLKERIELIKGKLLKMSPAPSRKHQKIAVYFTGVFFNYFRNHPCGLYAAPFDVRLPRKGDTKVYTVVQPDLCVVCDADKLDDRGCLGAPDFIIEILSPGNTNREMKEKFDVYEESGVREYWLVHPTDKTVFIYVLNEHGKYIGLHPAIEEDDLSPTIFPDLVIPLREVFED